MSEELRSTIRVGTCPEALIIAPGPRCLAPLCPTIEAILKDPRFAEYRRLVFDLSQSRSMDSSFVGVLIGLIGRKRRPAGFELQLCNPNREILRILETMGVLHYFEVVNQLPDPIDAWVDIPVSPAAPDRLTDLVIDAHENLMDADPRNVDKFEPVVRGLKRFRDEGSTKSEGDT